MEETIYIEQCVCGLIFYNIDVRLDYSHENICIELKVETSFDSSAFFGWIHVVKLSSHSHLEYVHYVFDKMSHLLLHFSVFFGWIYIVKMSFHSHLEHVHHVFDKISHSLLRFSLLII